LREAALADILANIVTNRNHVHSIATLLIALLRIAILPILIKPIPPNTADGM
jgi:NADH:ubiquinone oxidoreductase subunit 6 (subunit J)